MLELLPDVSPFSVAGKSFIGGNRKLGLYILIAKRCGISDSHFNLSINSISELAKGTGASIAVKCPPYGISLNWMTE